MKKGVVGIVSAIGGALTSAAVVGKKFNDRAKANLELSDKHFKLFLMMNEWVKVKQEGKNLSSFFEREGYKEIAVYGMSYAGETLVEELEGSDIRVKYGIDRNADQMDASIEIVKPDEELKDVDVIVVTSITFFNEIEEMLVKKVNCPIISLEDVLYEV